MYRSVAVISTLLLIGGGAAMAQQTTPLSAEESNPETMGWMQGFPPADNKTIRFTDPDYFAFPKLRWTVCNFQQLMPTVGVSRGPGASRTLEQNIDIELGEIKFTPLNANESMTWDEAFDVNYSDGVIVLHKDTIVYERYSGCLNQTVQHGAMSVTKALTGLLGEILVTEGALDENALVKSIIPELEDSAFGNATVQQVMEMTTSLDYSEDYADPNADVWIYAEAASPLPKPEGYTGPRSYFEYLQTVKPDLETEHGNTFAYKTINADALGWIVARTTGKSVDSVFSEWIWQRIGAERDGFYSVDSIGTPFAGGGFNAALRDLARLGQLMLDEGQIDGEQIIPAAAVKRIHQGGSLEAFANSHYTALKGWSYRSMWWNTHNEHEAFAARGVHGQTIYVDPTAEMVVVRFASHPVAANSASDPTSLPAYQAVAEYLMMQPEPETLTGGEWFVEDIDGGGVIDDTQASLAFSVDGRLSGLATCNRINGSYEVTGGDLEIGPLGTTLMACPEALENQERKLLTLLERIAHFDIDDTGALQLRTVSGETVTARRR